MLYSYKLSVVPPSHQHLGSWDLDGIKDVVPAVNCMQYPILSLAFWIMVPGWNRILYQL